MKASESVNGRSNDVRDGQMLTNKSLHQPLVAVSCPSFRSIIEDLSGCFWEKRPHNVTIGAQLGH